MNKPIVEIGINEKERKIILVVPLDEFYSCTKTNWSLLRDDIKKDLIENKYIVVEQKDKQ